MMLFLIVFWLTLYSSLAWTLGCGCSSCSLSPLGQADTGMPRTATIGSLIGIYLEFFWDQERRLVRAPILNTDSMRNVNYPLLPFPERSHPHGGPWVHVTGSHLFVTELNEKSFDIPAR